MNKVKIDSQSKTCIKEVYKSLNEVAEDIYNREIIIVCIGTDRSTGDSLGPLIGTMLSKHRIIRNNYHVYGTIQNPVHAQNLNGTLKDIKSRYNSPYIIAIDASLGNMEDIGKIIIRSGSVAPGAALNKELPLVGDLSVMGVVNTHGSMEFMVLQNTRLWNVYYLAEKIEKGLTKFLKEQIRMHKPIESVI